MRNFLLLFLSGLLFSCSHDAYYQEYVDFKSTQWNQDSIVEFKVKVEDISRPFMVGVELRHNDDYPYSNLYLFRTISSSDGIEYTDTVNYTLANPSGAWVGKGMGAVKTMKYPFARKTLQLNHPGEFTFTFQQGMRDENLPGILSLGLSLEQTPEHE